MKTLQKQLFNGRTVDGNSEQWREQCEAQTILNLPRRSERWDYIRRVEEKRGESPALRLQAIMVNMMPTQRQRDGIIAALMHYRSDDYRREFRKLLSTDEFNNPPPDASAPAI